MNAPRGLTNGRVREEFGAPAPVRRQRPNLLRRHWLTGAFVCTLCGVLVYTGHNFYETELKLQQVQQANAQLEDQINALKRKKELLDGQIRQVKSPEYLEVQARKQGFVKQGEIMFQQGSSPGR
ncbi:MAG TPA: septum formation initiator family protein [Symbiobacteriaceae bacterium]|nr:septum formation initiator family protein [Symbiobacteriaceae bacterium]